MHFSNELGNALTRVGIHFGQNLDAFWPEFGNILARIWIHLPAIGIHFGKDLDLFDEF